MIVEYTYDNNILEFSFEPEDDDILEYNNEGCNTRFIKLNQKKHVDYAIKYLQQNQSISTRLLHKIVKKKYNDFNISTDHLHQVIRDNNITRKRTKIRQ